MEAEYNDIATWNNKDLVPAFGGKEGKYRLYQIRAKDQVNELFTDKEFNAADCLQFVELYIPKEDAPRALVLTAEASAKNNAKQ